MGYEQVNRVKFLPESGGGWALADATLGVRRSGTRRKKLAGMHSPCTERSAFVLNSQLILACAPRN